MWKGLVPGSGQLHEGQATEDFLVRLLTGSCERREEEGSYRGI
jgi:hypothetical protein